LSSFVLQRPRLPRQELIRSALPLDDVLTIFFCFSFSRQLSCPRILIFFLSRLLLFFSWRDREMGWKMTATRKTKQGSGLTTGYDHLNLCSSDSLRLSRRVDLISNFFSSRAARWLDARWERARARCGNTSASLSRPLTTAHTAERWGRG
jgi:hypothetical protein